MNSYIVLTVLCACSCAASAARPLKGEATAARRHHLRGLSQYFADDPHLWIDGTNDNIHANMGFSRMDPDTAKSLINDYNQAAVQNGDLSYLTDTQASMTLSRQNFAALKDMLNQRVETATVRAAETGDAATPNAVAQGTTAVWTTAVLPTNNNMRASLAGDNTQGAVMVALESDNAHDVFRATNTGQAHTETMAMPTGWFNW